MEARLANIVHHMTGEADEESMSAWESYGSCSPAEPAPPGAQRRSSFGPQVTSFDREPLLELEESGAGALVSRRGQEEFHVREPLEPGQEGPREFNGATRRFSGVWEGDAGGGDGIENSGAAIGWGSGPSASAGGFVAAGGSDGDEKGMDARTKTTAGDAAGGEEDVDRRDGVEADDGASKVLVNGSRGDTSTKDPCSADREGAAPSESPTSTTAPPEGNKRPELGTDGGQRRKRSRQARDVARASDQVGDEDRQGCDSPSTRSSTPERTPHRQSERDDSIGGGADSNNNNNNNSSNVLDSRGRTSEGRSTANSEKRNANSSSSGRSEHAGFKVSAPHIGTPAAVVTSSALESSRDVARRRWVWAYGRVCHLLRRRKRKQFEIMSQRATDRTVRMGSRVSVVERRLDETRSALDGVEHLRAKATAQTLEIKELYRKIAELSALVGVEDRVKGLVEDSQAHMEHVVKSGDLDLEAKLRSGHEELEGRLAGEMKRHAVRLEDMTDRFGRNDDAIRRAEERIGDMEEEVNTVTQTIVELERQLALDQKRLDSLEAVKQAQQRRLSELKVVEPARSSSSEAGMAAIQTDDQAESPGERMARLLDSAATTLEFLSVDIDKVVANAETSLPRGHHEMVGVLEQLQAISGEAGEFAGRCRRQGELGAQGKVDGTIIVAGERDDLLSQAETLCVSIQRALSGDGGSVPSPRSALSRTSVSVDESRKSTVSLCDLQCPNGRFDLPTKLEAARDALLPIVSEVFSAGALRIALLELRADLERARDDPGTQNEGSSTADNRWQDVRVRLSDLDTSLAEVKRALAERGIDVNHHGEDRDLEDQLCTKADAAWVQRELRRLWDALNSRAVTSTTNPAAMSSTAVEIPVDPTLPRKSSSPSQRSSARNPETAGEESDPSPPLTPAAPTFPPISGAAAAGSIGTGDSGLDTRVGEKHGTPPGEHRGPSSGITETSPLIKDLMRKTSRLDQQIMAKADSEEVMRALSSIGTKLRKLNAALPALEDSLSSKIERKELNKLTALILGGGDDQGSTSGGGGDDGAGSGTSAVLASRLNSKFRCLSCDRPLPSIGPPGPPKPNHGALSISGSCATPPSPQKHSRISAAVGDVVSTTPHPSSPGGVSSRSDTGDFGGWGAGSSRITTPPGLEDTSPASPLPACQDVSTGSSLVPASGRPRPAYIKGGGNSRRDGSARSATDQPVRSEPEGANAPGEQIAGVMSRYPRMMPPPSRIRTAAGGGGAGIGIRPGSSGNGFGARF